MKRTYAVVLGTRPEIVKFAPLILKAQSHPSIDLLVIHTDQHYDRNLSDVFFEELGLPPADLHLSVAGETGSVLLGRLINEVTSVLTERKDTLSGVLVLGDANSTLAGGVAASRVGLPLFHLEGGLRSHDARMPEEANRIVLDHLSEVIFTTEAAANENLLKEGISEERIRFVGNIVAEAIEQFVDDTTGDAGKYVVATIHRREHTSDRSLLDKIFGTLSLLGKRRRVVMPLHPSTRKRLTDEQLTDHLSSIEVVDPLGYHDFSRLIRNSSGVLTDSGGVQEETTHLGIPCVTLRDSTERPVTIELGSNLLVPTATLVDADLDVIEAHLSRKDFSKKHIPLWDTGVSDRILSEL